MFPSPSSSEYHARRPGNRTSLPAPSLPQRTTPGRPLTVQHRASMPSPLKHHVVTLDNVDDVFSSPAGPTNFQSRRMSIYDSEDEDEGFSNDSGFAEDPAIFRSLPSFAPPSSSPFPFRTPVKDFTLHGVDPLGRTGLSSVRTSYSPVSTAGTKRKPAPTPTSLTGTPDRRHTMTPLHTSRSHTFDRLAPPPLSAPRFGSRTPHTKAQTEEYLRSGEDSLTRLRIKDHDMAALDAEFDKDSEAGPGTGAALFADLGNTSEAKVQPKRLTTLSIHRDKGKGVENADEVVEDMSPGGHINKRRARSRPVSRELQMLSGSNTPASKDTARTGAAPRGSMSTSKSAGSVPFPSSTRRIRRASGPSAPSEATSPRARPRRQSGTVATARGTGQAAPKRPPFGKDGVRNVSAASLFFGPAIPQSEAQASRKQSIGGTTIDADAPTPERERKSSWRTDSSPGLALWPAKSQSPAMTGRAPTEDEEMDAFFSSPPEKGLRFSITSCTPSPTKASSLKNLPMLPKKFRARDSGIAMDADSSEDEGIMGRLATRPGLMASSSGHGSGSFSSLYSESGDEALVTPLFGPGPNSGWPRVGIVGLEDVNALDNDGGLDMDTGETDGVEAFVLRTLSANTKAAPVPGEPQRVPGTPVKRLKTANHLVNRPWQSAVAHKVGLPEFDPPREGEGKDVRPRPRKSLPALFNVPATTKETRTRKDALSFTSSIELDADDDEASPSTRKQTKKNNSTKPPVPLFPGRKGAAITRPPSWVSRRSSSGAFSSGGSDCTISANGTPTRMDTPIGAPARHLPEHSPLVVNTSFEFTSSQSSIASGISTATNSPTVAAVARHTNMQPPATDGPQHRRGRSQGGSFDLTKDCSPKKSSLHAPRTASRPRSTHFPGSAFRNRLSLASSEERPGRFERDFVEVNELGQGEFGRVMKARYKENFEQVFAVKKCKRFEGVKHRLRLREEVDVLKHLATVASEGGFQPGHPNVLGYIDSWEEDEQLYIQTELCELGNFAHFLWDFGREYPKLDEARVWKIFAELSGGLRFIHAANIIHLDLKPANIFITEEGRFKIGDFGLASVWPRPKDTSNGPLGPTSFEREGDKLYLAPEVLQGKYSAAADIFGLGMTMLETATNIIVPDQGDEWHRLRHDHFEQVDFSGCSSELVTLLKRMMLNDAAKRIDANEVYLNSVITQARVSMEIARKEYGPVRKASALFREPEGWLEEVLARANVWDTHEPMDTSP